MRLVTQNGAMTNQDVRKSRYLSQRDPTQATGQRSSQTEIRLSRSSDLREVTPTGNGLQLTPDGQAMYRVKQLFGGHLTLRDDDAQLGEAMAMIRDLTRAGMPESVRIA